MFNVGFVGLGHQGKPIAEMIERSGWPLFIYARRPATLEPFRSTTATPVASLLELGERSEMVGICVVDDAQVEEVVLGSDLLAGMRSGSIIVVYSTVHPETCRKLAAETAKRGVTLIDAPVSGDLESPYRRDLTVMVGGDPEVFERCLPVFQTFGNPVRLMGPVGKGQLAKLVNNLLFTANIALVDDALQVGDSLGLDRDALVAVVAASSGGSPALNFSNASPAPRASERATRLLRKDVDLVSSVIHGADSRSDVILAVAEKALRTMEARVAGA